MYFQEAKDLMEQGAVMGNGSDFDYYRIDEGELIGFYSCDDEDYTVKNPPLDGWYFIYWRTDI